MKMRLEEWGGGGRGGGGGGGGSYESWNCPLRRGLRACHTNRELTITTRKKVC